MTIQTDRTKRVKEARDEAKKEIDAYRKQKDDEFKKFEAEVCYLISGTTYIMITSNMFCKTLVRHTNNFSSIQVETKRRKKTQIRTRKYR